ncbi:MAG: polyamine aminopropyltransferase [Chitinispirillaceae bacterium]|nr:polyamine aminopropyltransferase [Chitinispirillaceae bacterium]
MQKSFRKIVYPDSRIAKGRTIFLEPLNPYFGYFYTVNRRIMKKRSEFQDIELYDTDEFGKVLILDKITQLGEKCDFCYHEPMVHPVMCFHPRAENILIIGGGDGCLVREVLKYPYVKKIEIAELDGEVIEFAQKYLSKLNKNAFDDERVHLNIVDGRKYTQEHPKEFDVIIMDMTDPFGPSQMLYTREFFKIVKRAFRNDNGLFVMHSESPITRPLAFSCISKTLNSVFSYVNQFYIYIQMYGVLWSITVSSDKIDVSKATAKKIDKKLKKYGIDDLKVYNGATHLAMQVPYPYIEKRLKKEGRIITDKNPDFPDDFISQE